MRLAGSGDLGGGGCQGKDLGEIQELTDTIPEELTEDDLTLVHASEPVPDNKEEDVEAVPENKMTLENLAEGLRLFKTAFDFLYSMDSSMR